MSENETVSPTREHTAQVARQQTRRAIIGTVRETGGHEVTRPLFRDRPDLDMTVTDAEPMAALRATAAVGHALRRITCEHARRAREDGQSWQDIGVALGFERSPVDGPSAAEAAYDQVAGEPGFRARSFSWVCPGCGGTVIDRGPEAGRPEDCEESHVTGCPRLAAAVAAWNAAWDEEDIR